MTLEEILPSVEACRAVGCPDLVAEEYLMGRTRRVCRPAGNRIPGNLARCPTGYLSLCGESKPGGEL